MLTLRSHGAATARALACAATARGRLGRREVPVLTPVRSHARAFLARGPGSSRPAHSGRRSRHGTQLAPLEAAHPARVLLPCPPAAPPNASGRSGPPPPGPGRSTVAESGRRRSAARSRPCEDGCDCAAGAPRAARGRDRGTRPRNARTAQHAVSGPSRTQSREPPRVRQGSDDWRAGPDPGPGGVASGA
jgi:hypothetical protein